MIDISLLRENPQIIEETLRKRNISLNLREIILLDEEKRKLQKEIDNLRHKKSILSKGQTEEARRIKEEIKEREKEFKIKKEEFEKKFKLIPNIPLTDVPEGKSDKENIVLREVGKKPEFDFQPKDYLSLSEKLSLIDIKRAAKVSGSRFGYLKGLLASLEFALISFAFSLLLDKKFIREVIEEKKLDLTDKPFLPIIPPVMIRPEMMAKMGYLSWHPEEVYFLKDDDLCLVGTSEQSIGPMFANEILKEEDLPLRFLSFSTCFRREAGSYGKDTKGILRVHQFDKLEMFSFASPEKSILEHQLFLSLEEKMMEKLSLPYRVVRICSGDLSIPSASSYDIETWLPGQNEGQGEYRETHSTSNCTDYQARSLNIRFSDKKNKKRFIHTINGTAFALGRMIIAIIENYQKKDGTIEIPGALKKFII